MWLSILFPSLNESNDKNTTFYSASPYGMPIILHKVGAGKALLDGQQTEYFDA